MWDRVGNPNSRVFVHLKTRENILLELIVINFNFKIEILSQESATNILIGFGPKKLELRLKCLLGLDNLEFLFDFKSSFLTTRVLRSHVKFNQRKQKSKTNFNTVITFLVRFFKL